MTDPEQPAPRSGAARWGVALAAVVVLVVAFAALRGGSDDEPGGRQASRASTTQPAPAQQQQEQEQEQQQPTAESQQKPAAPALPTVRVRGGEPVGGPETLEFHKGERIRFRVVADAPDEVHFHGYDIEKEVGPGMRARFDVKATIEGRFEVELHHSGAQIARVDVLP